MISTPEIAPEGWGEEPLRGNTKTSRVAINISSGHFPGLDLAAAGAVLARTALMGDHRQMVETAGHGGRLISTAARTDPLAG